MLLFMIATVVVLPQQHLCVMASSSTPVPFPVTVSTVTSSTLGVSDITITGNGDIIAVSYAASVVYRIYTAGNANSVVRIAGTANTPGSTDGIGAAARFRLPLGITSDTSNDVAYIGDYNNHRIRKIDLRNNNVSTLAGSSQGNNDGIGVQAQFYCPTGVIYMPSGGILYVADTKNYLIRRVVVATANVTTIVRYSTTYGLCNYLIFSRDEATLFVTLYYAIMRVTIPSGDVTLLAGSSSNSLGYADGPGASARFDAAVGIAMNSDESALIVVDQYNNVVRSVDLSGTSKNVTTIAGQRSVARLLDGPGLGAAFNQPFGGKWYCNVSSATRRCGMLVADYLDGAIRFIAIEGPTITASSSASPGAGSTPLSASHTSSAQPSPSRTISVERTATTSPTTSHTAIRTCGSPSPSKSVSEKGTAATASATFSRIITPSRRSAVVTSSFSTTNLLGSFSEALSNSSSRSYSMPSATHSHSSTLHTHSQSSYCTLVVNQNHSFGSLLLISSSPLLPSLPQEGDVVALMPIPTALLPPLSSSRMIPYESTISAAPLSRKTLLQTLPLAMNLSLNVGGTSPQENDDINSSPLALGGWLILRVVLNVLYPATPTSSDGALQDIPLLSSVIPFSVLSTEVVDHQQLFTLVVYPSNETTPSHPHWLPGSLSMFRDVNVELYVLLRCARNMEAVANVTIRVACPGEIQPLASQVKAVGIAAQYVTVVTRPAVSGAVGRVAAVRSLVLCNGDSLMQGMLMLSVKACDDGDDGGVADDARGIVLGNLVLWSVGCAVSALAVAAYYALGGKSCSIRHAVNQLGVPSQLLPLAISTVPSTASATVYLLNSSSTNCGSNIALAIVGIFMCFFPLATLCGVAYAVPRHLKLRMTTRHGHQHQQRHRRSAIELMKLFAALLFHRQFRWTPSEQGNNSSADALVHEVMGNEHELSSRFLDRRLQVSGNDAATVVVVVVVVVDGNTSLSWHRTATVILLEYITLWYATLDLTVLVAACFLGAVGAAISSSTACRASAVIILLLYAGQLIVCAVVRPFTTLFAHVYSLFTLLFTVIAVLCQVVFLYAVLDGGSNNTNVEMLRQLLMTAAVCDLVVTGVSILRALLDGIDVIRAIYRHAQVLVAAVRRSSTPPPRAFVAPTTYVANEANEEFFADEIPIVDNNNVNHNNANADVPLSDSLQLLSELDDVFWTSDGKAAVLLASLHSNKDSDKTPEEEGIRSSHYHEWDRD